MKKMISLLFLVWAAVLSAQNKTLQKPVRIIVVNNEIISLEKAEEYGKAGRITLMQNGVTDEQLKQLTEKMGDVIGTDGRFIIMITLNDSSSTKPIAQPLNKPGAVLLKKEDEYVLAINDTAKDFTVPMTEGPAVQLSALKGKVVLINFWSTWCAPCITELYDVPEKILQPFRNSEFVFLTIATGEPAEKVVAEVKNMKTKGLILHSGIDADKAIWNAYGKSAIPKSFLVDKAGIIRYVSSGYNDAKMDLMVTEIKKLLRN